MFNKPDPKTINRKKYEINKSELQQSFTIDEVIDLLKVSFISGFRHHNYPSLLYHEHGIDGVIENILKRGK